MNIAIVGGNLGGAYLGYLLAESGFSVTLFDSNIPHEKPCGGGVSYRTFKEFPFLQQPNIVKKPINKVKLISHNDFAWEMPLNDPLHIYSRKEIAKNLMNIVMKAGIRFIPKRVIDLNEDSKGFQVKTKDKSFHFDFVVGADGARSLVRRRVRGSFPRNNYSLALGYFLPGSWSDKITLKFHSKIKGYIWVFPRVDHMSIGIGSLVSSVTPKKLKSILDDFLLKEYPGIDLNKGKYYSAFIPSLSAEYLSHLKCAGSRWALLGDAAGFADPITGEGIYYALKSAEILGNCLISGKVEDYDNLWKISFGRELQKSASLSSFFYNHYFTESAILIASKSKSVQDILSDLITGQQSYLTLKNRLLSKFLNCVKDTILHADIALNKRLFKNLKYIRANW